MSTFKTGVTNNKGEYIFPEHLVTVKVGKNVKIANAHQAGLALQLAYVAMSVKADVKSFDDVTKRNAGAAVLPFIEALPEQAVFTFHHGKECAERDLNDVTKHIAIIEVSQPDMLKTAKALAAVRDIMNEVQAKIEEVVKPAMTCTFKELNPCPVYFAGKEGKAKRASGDKSFAPMTF
jgi:hypothetical protein